MAGNFFGGQFFGGGFFGADSGAVTPPSIAPSGGFPANDRRGRKEISKARERFGLIDETKQKADRIIHEIALRQAQRDEQDRQKQFEELSRELKINEIEWEGKYLEALVVERERLVKEKQQALENARLVEEERVRQEIQSAADFKVLLALAQKFELDYRQFVIEAIKNSESQVEQAIQKTGQIINLFQQSLEAKGEPEAMKTEKEKEIQEKFLGELEQVMKDLKELK